MIAVDGTPLETMPRAGVGRALAELLAGWSRAFPDDPLQVFTPTQGESARRFRRRLPGLVADSGAGAFFSPWSAFPDLDVPVVALVHELPFVRLGPIEGRWRTSRHRAWLKRNVTECAAIIVPSWATREDLLALHPEAAPRVHAIPNAFDPSPWRAADASSRDPAVVMVGIGHDAHSRRKKGLDVLLAAWREAGLEGWTLHLVGEAPPRLPGDVEVHRDLEQDALGALIARCRILVYPSRSEGFGYPPLEAAACGTPVAGTVAGSIPEVAVKAELVMPGDVAALARALRTLADEPAAVTRQRLDVAREKLSGFDPVRIARGYRAVFQSIGVPA